MSGIPFCVEPWSMIVPGLYQGGHDYQPDGGAVMDVIVRGEFDLVISLYRRSGFGPAEGVEHEVMTIPDGPLAAIRGVERLADKAADAMKAGKKVLVRCQAGYNRSGLVVALVLMRFGLTAEDAIAKVQVERSPWALSNEHFTRYLRSRS